MHYDYHFPTQNIFLGYPFFDESHPNNKGCHLFRKLVRVGPLIGAPYGTDIRQWIYQICIFRRTKSYWQFFLQTPCNPVYKNQSIWEVFMIENLLNGNWKDMSTLQDVLLVLFWAIWRNECHHSKHQIATHYWVRSR